jgi:2'-5' RNA ligase
MGAMQKTLTIQKAVEIAEQLGDSEFSAAVETARTAQLRTVEVVTVEEDGGEDIYVLRPRTAMIAWKPTTPERYRIAIPNGEPGEDIHMTVIYLGDIANFTDEQQRTIIGVTAQVAQQHTRISGRMNKLGRFLNDGDEHPLWVSGDFPGLRELHDKLERELREAGIEWEDTHPDWTPHVTIGWIDAEAAMPAVTINPYDTEIDNLTIYWGGLEYRVELDGPDWSDVWIPEGNLYVPLLKNAAEPVKDVAKRYTYGPWYVPDQVDLHGEWASRDDVQEALWKYVDTGDRDIRLQHDIDTVAGRWVELATMPFPITVPMVDEAGVVQKYTYPPGTPFMGVIWEEWSWPLVEQDLIKGFSIGGSAKRLLVDLPEEAVAKARG